MRVSHRTNKLNIEEVHADRRLSGMVLERVIKYFGHLTRSDTSLEGIIVQDKVEGKRRRGRSPAKWADQIGSNKDPTWHYAPCLNGDGQKQITLAGCN